MLPAWEFLLILEIEASWEGQQYSLVQVGQRPQVQHPEIAKPIEASALFANFRLGVCTLACLVPAGRGSPSHRVSLSLSDVPKVSDV